MAYPPTELKRIDFSSFDLLCRFELRGFGYVVLNFWQGFAGVTANAMTRGDNRKRLGVRRGFHKVVALFSFGVLADAIGSFCEDAVCVHRLDG